MLPFYYPPGKPNKYTMLLSAEFTFTTFMTQSLSKEVTPNKLLIISFIALQLGNKRGKYLTNEGVSIKVSPLGPPQQCSSDLLLIDDDHEICN